LEEGNINNPNNEECVPIIRCEEDNDDDGDAVLEEMVYEETEGYGDLDDDYYDKIEKEHDAIRKKNMMLKRMKKKECCSSNCTIEKVRKGTCFKQEGKPTVKETDEDSTGKFTRS